MWMKTADLLREKFPEEVWLLDLSKAETVYNVLVVMLDRLHRSEN